MSAPGLKELTPQVRLMAPRPALGGMFDPPTRIAVAPPRTARIRCIATGELIERQHIDCRELIATGEYEPAP